MIVLNLFCIDSLALISKTLTGVAQDKSNELKSKYLLFEFNNV